jgi:hypothetical protein
MLRIPTGSEEVLDESNLQEALKKNNVMQRHYILRWLQSLPLSFRQLH